MQTRTRLEANYDKTNAILDAENAGQVADSMDVRANLIAQMQRGEKTLLEIQAELAKIKKDAKKSGKLTRTQVWNRS